MTDIEISPRAEQPDPTPPVPPTGPTAPQWVAVVAITVATGYLAIGRGFAHIGLNPLFIGEALLLLSLLYPSSRKALLNAANGLVRPGAFHVLSWVMLVTFAYGVFQVIYGIRLGHDTMTVLQTSAFSFYVVFLFIGLWVGRCFPRIIEQLVLTVAWVNMVYGLAFIAVLGRLKFAIPTTGIPVNGAQASGVALIGLFTIRPRTRFYWWLVAGNTFVLLAQQKRAEWFGLVAAVLVFAFLTRRIKPMAIGVSVLALLMVLVSVLDLDLSGVRTRGGSLDPGTMFGRIVAPFDEDLASQFVEPDELQAFSGTARWRSQWWDGIWTSVHERERTTLFGLGYGYPLHELGEAVADDVRTPHNIFYFALGYGGWLGVLILLLLQSVLVWQLYRAFRSTGQPFGLCFWVTCLGIGLFSNFFEAPFGAIPFYLVLGMILGQAAGPVGMAVGSPERASW